MHMHMHAHPPRGNHTLSPMFFFSAVIKWLKGLPHR